MTTIFGVDLGQAQDFTAIAAVEAPGLEDATASVEYHVRHLDELAASGSSASAPLVRARHNKVGQEIAALRIEARRLKWKRLPFVQPDKVR